MDHSAVLQSTATATADPEDELAARLKLLKEVRRQVSVQIECFADTRTAL